MDIVVERTANDGLSRDVWRFYAHFGYGQVFEMRLDTWKREARPSRRHAWRQDGEGYKRRHHNGHRHFGMRKPAAEVPLPEDDHPTMDDDDPEWIEALDAACKLCAEP